MWRATSSSQLVEHQSWEADSPLPISLELINYRIRSMYGLPTIQTKGGCSRMGTRLVGAITNCFPSSRSYMEAGAAPKAHRR